MIQKITNIYVFQILKITTIHFYKFESSTRCSKMKIGVDHISLLARLRILKTTKKERNLLTLVPNFACTIGQIETLTSQWREPSWIFPLLTHNPLHLTGRVFSASDPTSHIKLRFDIHAPIRATKH